MSELPEIMTLAQEINTALAGKTICNIEVLQPKCLNVPEETFITALNKAQIQTVRHKGKWLLTETSHGRCLD